MREIQFRAWHSLSRYWIADFMSNSYLTGMSLDQLLNHGNHIKIMQFTGLKDKNNPCQDIYEGDIIDENGKVIGNVYEQSPLHERSTDLVIERFGTKGWCATYQEAVGRGCTDSE